MEKKSLPRYKSSKYYAKFEVKWIEDGGMFNRDEKELIDLFKSDGEFTPESEVGIKNESFSKKRTVYWERATKEGKEKICLAEIEPDENFLDFLNRFFRKGMPFLLLGYRKTNYCIIRAICRLYQEKPEEFQKMAKKARNLEEFIVLMGIR